jgi:hypothetical protein
MRGFFGSSGFDFPARELRLEGKQKQYRSGDAILKGSAHGAVRPGPAAVRVAPVAFLKIEHAAFKFACMRRLLPPSGGSLVLAGGIVESSATGDQVSLSFLQHRNGFNLFCR